MNAAQITFTNTLSKGAWVTYTCDMCGAAVIDWTGSQWHDAERNEDGHWKNQAKHAAWHVAIGAPTSPTHAASPSM